MDATPSAVIASFSPEVVAGIHDSLFVLFSAIGLLLFVAGYKMTESWLKR